MINDHELIIQGVAAMLEPYADVVRVVELDAGTTVAQPVDIALYDTYARTGFDGDDLDVLCAAPHIGQVVLFTWHLSEELIESARARGVTSAISKSVGAEDLVMELTRAHEGHLRVIPFEPDPSLPTNSWPGRAAGLTPRESEIIALVTAGLSNNAIAERTYLSINSVKSYIRSAYRTMGVDSRSQAVLWGIDNGMAPTRKRIVLEAPPTPVDY